MFNAPSKALVALLVATGLGATTAPALAKSAAPQENSIKFKVKEKNGQTLYCMSEQAVTGSILNKKRCLSREDWAQLGVTIPAAGASAGAAKDRPAS